MIIGGLIENSFVDYPTKICCTIFTIGCNMNCWYCHNNHLLDNNAKQISQEEVLSFLYSHKGFLDAVTISGGEPTLQSDLEEFIKKIKSLGYFVKLDTNGTNYLVLKKLIENNLVDYIAMDIKAPLNKYNFISKSFDIEEIQKSIDLLKQNKVDYEFRTTLPKNITLKDIEEISRTLKNAKTYCLQKIKHENIKGKMFLKPIIKNNSNAKCKLLIVPTTKTGNIFVNKNFLNLNKYFIFKNKNSKLLKAKQIASKYIDKVIIKGL